MRSRLLVALLASLALAPSLAHAFADSSQFFDSNANPHGATFGATGEGVYFTGAPRFASLNCQSCHVGAPGLVGLRLGADDPSLFTNGYEPGLTYLLEIELTGETAGTRFATPTCTDPPSQGDTFSYVQCNNNGYALEIDAAGVPLAGPNVYCAQPRTHDVCPMPDYTVDESLVAPDGDAAFSNRVYSADVNMPKLVERNGANKWHLYWTAPKAGTGPLTIYVAAVDGNGGNGTLANDQDPFGDDAVQANFFLQEAGATVNGGASAGCSVGAVSGGAPWVPVLLLAALYGCARQRRRSAAFQVRLLGRTVVGGPPSLAGNAARLNGGGAETLIGVTDGA